jgi:hypothetical protein
LNKADLIQQTKTFLQLRKAAYQRVFDDKDQMSKAVLEDLAKFCRADETTFHADPRIHAALEGRREVYLRIQSHLKLDLETLFKITTKGNS